ncbi:MAG TPA: copper amine oxidase N-terminal domain-containing protein [Candidatus Baltobacteraceae bacterium]|nr:copper amine oxidase N-terminal domain-containing protein [Candidatus Baltobacteraceae bacterium]
MTYRAPSWRTLLATTAVAAAAASFVAFSRPIVMSVDGQRIQTDVPPVSAAADKVFVPLRSIADALGAQTSVDEKSGSVEVVRGSQSLRVRVGNVHAKLDGVAFTLKHAPFRVRGRVMIGLKVVAEAFGVQARYDPRTASIEILTPGIGQTTTPTAADQTQ